MKIINYWPQLSKHYIFSHLLLGVIAAGFGFSTNVFALPAITTTESPNAMISFIAKANRQDISNSTPHCNHYQLSSAMCSSAESYDSPQLIARVQRLQSKGYSLSNPIRAGPESIIS